RHTVADTAFANQFFDKRGQVDELGLLLRSVVEHASDDNLGLHRMPRPNAACVCQPEGLSRCFHRTHSFSLCSVLGGLLILGVPIQTNMVAVFCYNVKYFVMKSVKLLRRSRGP